ncbi:LysR family transcriptional regulator [Pseudomonas sp. WN033]|nr:LysR family transcriptional regulator [Pseudomonas sp. WN033]
MSLFVQASVMSSAVLFCWKHLLTLSAAPCSTVFVALQFNKIAINRRYGSGELTMDLNLMRSFVDILNAGSLSEAARRKGCTRSNVSKELKSLEKALGATLVQRTTRQFEVTEQGRVIYEHALRMLEEMESARAVVDSLGKQVRGHVRLSIPPALGQYFLLPRLFDFQQRNPDVALNLLISNRVYDLVASQVDVAVRVATVPPLDVVAREVCGVRWGLYATAELVASLPNISVPEALQRVPILCLASGQSAAEIKLKRGSELAAVRVKPRLQSPSASVLHEGMRCGLGVAVLPEYMVASELKSGDVVELLQDWIPEGHGGTLYVMSLPERQLSRAATELIRELRALKMSRTVFSSRPVCAATKV